MKALPYDAKMSSPEIQNVLLHLTTSVLHEHIEHEVKNVSFYAVLADEVEDASMKEFLPSLCSVF